MKNYFTYILYSSSVNKYCVGYTSDMKKRIERHGQDKSKFTGQTDDWVIVKYFEFGSKSEAMKLESKIKKRGIKRFLEDLEISS